MTEHRLNLTALAASLVGGGHSIFSPSGSAMWLNCSGSLIPNILMPDTSGIEAAEGTVAHLVGETWLRSGKKPRHLLGTTQYVHDCDPETFDPDLDDCFKIEVTHEMLNYVQEYVDWCSVLPGDHFVETKVYFSKYMPIERQGGTADHVACSWQHMVITDLKFGKGIPVQAEGNTQGLLYALGFFLEWDWLYDFQTITIRIAQPRLSDFSEWTVTREFLLEWAEWARERAHLAWQINAPRVAGYKQCLWCKVKADCAAHVQMQNELVSAAFADIGQPVTEEKALALKDSLDFREIVQHADVFKLDIGQLAFLYSYRRFAESWWKALHNELTRRALAGVTVPGMKIVEGRTHRKIKNNSVTVKALSEYGVERDELITETIESPAEIEKILRKHGVAPKDIPEILEPLVAKPAGKATLVSVADRRPALVDVSKEVFADLEDEYSENPEIES